MQLQNLVRLIDVDQDGFTDLVFLISRGGEPFFTTTVYRYNRDSSQFVLDDDFPGESEPVPAQDKGCVFTQARHSGGYAIYYYEITKWCEQRGPDAGWKLTSSCDSHTKRSCTDCGQAVTESCYRKRETELRKWQKVHQGEDKRLSLHRNY
jgi:hypothetical protein